MKCRLPCPAPATLEGPSSSGEKWRKLRFRNTAHAKDMRKTPNVCEQTATDGQREYYALRRQLESRKAPSQELQESTSSLSEPGDNGGGDNNNNALQTDSMPENEIVRSFYLRPEKSCDSLVNSSNPDEEYEVEAIRDISRLSDGSLEVLVKWKNWPETTNSWEPLSNTKCYEAIACFLIMAADRKYMPFVMRQYVQDRFKDPEANIFIVCQLLDLGFGLTQCLLLDFREKIRLRETLKAFNPKALLHNIKKHFGSELKFVQFVDSQQYLRVLLDELHHKVSDFAPHEAPVYFENLVDDQLPSTNLTLIQDYVFDEGITPRKSLHGCKCDNCEICECSELRDDESAPTRNYTIDGGLAEWARKQRGGPIIECHSNCQCLADCYNRVTQKGRSIELTVFKTDTDKKWGVRTNSPIKAWSFVVEYLGEIKLLQDAIVDDLSYIFELNSDGRQSPTFVIDSRLYSNINRFINHSCNPNMIAVKVFNKHLDLEMPRLAFFTCRDIRENEELTFDYRLMTCSRIPLRFGFTCCCGEHNCCGSL